LTAPEYTATGPTSVLPAWADLDTDWSAGITTTPATPDVQTRLLHVGGGLADAPPREQASYRPRHAVPAMRARALLGALGRAGANQVVVTDTPRRPDVSAPRTNFRLVGPMFLLPWSRRRRLRLPLPAAAAAMASTGPAVGADTVHVHLGGPGAQALVGLALALAPKRLVVHVGDLAAHGLRTGRRPSLADRLVAGTIEQALLRRADLVIVTTDRLAEAVGRAGKDRTVVLPPPPLPVAGMFRSAARPLPSLAGRRIVSVGPLVRRRQPCALVDAMLVQPPDTHLVLVGTGPEDIPVMQRAGELGLEGRVHLVPTAAWQTVVAHVRHADVLVTAALAGDDVFEAQVAAQFGTPVVATKTEGFTATISDRIDGRLVDPNDHDALASALRDLLTDPATAAELGASAGRRARAHSWGDVAKAVLNLTA